VASGGRMPAAGNCARGRFHTSWECGNCIGQYIDCGRAHCTFKCCMGNCPTKYNCKKCASDHCIRALKSCTGGYIPPNLWER
jgi:hypothetical protein